MPAKKVFGTNHHFAADEQDRMRQCRAVVLARSKKAAAEAFGATLYMINNYASVTSSPKEIRAANNAGEGVVVVMSFF